MRIGGDCHVGRGKRNPIYYKSFFDAVRNFLMEAYENNNETVILAGDVIDIAEPKPYDYYLLNQIIQEYNSLSHHKIIIIPGNHDHILSDGVSCLHNLNTDCVNLITERKLCKIQDGNDSYTVCFLPFTSSLDEDLHKPFPASLNKIDLLISHFTTKQMNNFAGTIDENDQVFDIFNKVILGDYHKPYEHNNKFFSTSGMYYWNVDEMIEATPSHIKVSKNVDGSININRCKHSLNEIKLIENEEDAIDSEKLYVMITDVDLKKQNIFTKFIVSDDDNQSISENVIPIQDSKITADTLLRMAFPGKENDVLVAYIKGMCGDEELINSLKNNEED